MDFGVLIFLLAHVPLALWMQESELVATTHAVAVFGIGLWTAANPRSAERVVWLMAYVTGAEVLWRMTHAHVLWEFGKYAVSALSFIALCQRHPRAGGPGPMVYLALLLPSAVLTATAIDVDFDHARQLVSFNLSGPLALAVCVSFFRGLRLSRGSLFRAFFAVASPIIGVATIAVSSTLAAKNLQFASASNLVTSGGFGPNQVSAVLGLAVLLLFLYVVAERGALLMRGAMLVLSLLLAAQCALTFSRTGLYLAGVGMVVAGLYFLGDRHRRESLTIVTTLACAASIVLLAPRLNQFTSGQLENRFADTNLTLRDELARRDLQMFVEHPVLGVGPGLGSQGRGGYIAHTELSRLLAEHGIFGLAAAGMLLALAWRSVAAQPYRTSRGVALSLTVWAMLFMAVSAMRLVAPAFLFGLAASQLRVDSPTTLQRFARTMRTTPRRLAAAVLPAG